MPADPAHLTVPVDFSRHLYNRATIGILCAALLVGATLRIDAVSRASRPEAHAGGDVARYYVSTAESFLAGKGWTPNYEYNYIPPPLQAFFIALIQRAAPGGDYQTIRAAQVVLSILTVGLAFLIGCLMGTRLTGAIAAVIIAVDPDIIGLVAILLTENNYFFLLFAFLALLLTALTRDSLVLLGLSGVLLGLTSLMKPFPMLLALLIPVYLVCRHRRRRRLAQAVVFFLAFALLISPWTIRNHLKYGGFHPVSTNAGTLLAQSNFPGLDSSKREMIYWEQIYRSDMWKNAAIEAEFAGKRDRYGRLEWNLKDKAYLEHAAGYIIRNPLHFLRNYGAKVYNSLRYPKRYDQRHKLRYRGLGTRWPFREFRHVLVLLGLPGVLLFGIRTWREPRFAMILILVYFVAFTALFHITVRGRINLPMKVLLSFFAAYAVSFYLEYPITRLRNHLRQRRSRRRSAPQPAVETTAA